jgi:EmrB/QacA subfamily drug resistance transporter
MSDHARPRPGLVLAIACAATFVAFLDVTVVNVAVPDLRRDFSDASLSLVSWVIAAYGVVFAAALTPAGRLADVIGRKAVFLAGFGTFTLASAATALAPSIGVLIAARALQGAGAGMMIPAALGIVLAVTPPERRSAAVGIWGMSSSLAAVAGPALGGVLIDVSDWRAVFAINIPLGLVVVVAAARVLPALRPEQRRLPDLLGTTVLTVGLALIVTALTQTGDWGWGDARTLGAAAGGAVLLAAAFLRASRHPVPAIEIGLWRNRAFAAVNASSLLFGFALFAWLLLGVLFTTGVWRYSILEAGLSVTPGALTAAVAAVVAGRIVDRYGARTLVAVTSVLFVGVVVWLAEALTAEPNFLGLWLPAGLLGGAALGATAVSLASAAARALPPAHFAAGSGLNLASRQLGGALGVALLASILDAADPGMSGYRTVFVLCGAAAALVALSAIFLARGSARVEVREGPSEAVVRAVEP